MNFGIKLADKEGFKQEYKRLRQLCRNLNYSLILFEDFDSKDDLRFFVGELVKDNELMFINMSCHYDEVLREIEEYLNFFARK